MIRQPWQWDRQELRRYEIGMKLQREKTGNRQKLCVVYKGNSEPVCATTSSSTVHCTAVGDVAMTFLFLILRLIICTV